MFMFKQINIIIKFTLIKNNIFFYMFHLKTENKKLKTYAFNYTYTILPNTLYDIRYTELYL